ncbi:PPE domain-containing protein [Gordonia aichiensis]|uniref:PPE domain-containing protein n=1 Tax=Gordonia aichiensis NBRC 108223 TaxID=1220583 RepID=L7KI04_9ACTN|nr:PPE domain-containing protein [Gordonia aichiensis]GAC47348.1 hypothetical protein GOACH_03_03660 [Gordonia aichiensis NBRC 108223]
MTGFTGVIWDARTTDRLVSDLSCGVGSAHLIDAGHAWTSVAAEMADAAMEYRAILSRVADAWQSAHAGAALERIDVLGRWFADAAAAASSNAVLALEQGAAAAVARLAMPAAPEVELVDGLRDLASSVSAVAPVITGAAAYAERARHDQRMRAARVMETYEQAATPAAKSWHVHSPAPQVVSDAALHAEQGAARSTRVRADAAPGAASTTAARPGAVMPTVSTAVATPVRAGYAPTTLASVAQAAQAAPTPVQRPASSETMPPPVAPVPAAAVATEHRMARSAVPVHCSDGAGSVDGASIAHESPATWAAASVATTPHVVIDAEAHAGAPMLDPAYFEQTLRLGEGDTR